MKSRTRRGRALAATAVVAALATTVPASAGDNAPPDTTGRWTVFYGTPDTRGYGTPDTRGRFTIEVLSQDNRRFNGLIRGFKDSAAIPMDGTVSESGNVSIQARGIDGTYLVIQAELSETTSDGTRIPALLEGTVAAKETDQYTEAQLVAVQQPAEASHTRLEGPYEGELHPVGGIPATLTAQFEETPTGEVVAKITVGDHHFEGVIALRDYFDVATKEEVTGVTSPGAGEVGLLTLRGYTDSNGRRPIFGELRITIAKDGETLTEGTFELVQACPTTHC